MAWHSALVFNKLDPAWRVIYAREEHPVLVERNFGNGSIVVSADSYWMSNQALRQDCHPDLLAWLVGRQALAVFDETHFGVSDTPGVAGLMRKYRLQGVLAGVLLLGALFVWKNYSSLVPPAVDDGPSDRSTGVGGRDSATGLVNLLRRSIDSPELLFACFDHWKAGGQHSGPLQNKLKQMEAVVAQERALPPARRTPVESYRRLCQILAEKK